MNNNISTPQTAVLTEPDKKLQRPFVSIVVPAYNEEKIIVKNLTVLCEYMKSLEREYQWEIIVVNDGSKDATGDLADGFAKKMDNAYVLHHMYNFRLGQALRFAFKKTRGDFIVVMDLDLSYSPDHIGRMLETIRSKRAKIVIASPYMKGGKVSNVPWMRKMLSSWGNWFLCLMAPKNWFSDKLTTITGMVRTYDGPFLRKLNLKAMDVDINHEIIYKAKILRARILEIPAHLNWEFEKSRKSLSEKRRSSFRIIRSIVQSLLSGFIFRPFMFFIFPGLVIFILSLYPLTYTFVHALNFYRGFSNLDLSFGHRLSGAIAEAFKLSPHSFIVGGMALMVSIQFISLGLLAIQKKRYFEELFHLGTSILDKDTLFKNEKPKTQQIL